MELYQIIFIYKVIVKIESIIKLRIIKDSKKKRIEKLEKMSNSKINAIANYEEKSKTIFFK